MKAADGKTRLAKLFNVSSIPKAILVDGDPGKFLRPMDCARSVGTDAGKATCRKSKSQGEVKLQLPGFEVWFLTPRVTLLSMSRTICLPTLRKPSSARRDAEARWPLLLSRAHEDRVRSTNTRPIPHLAPGNSLRRAIEADRIQSLIFYGPPGTGKTSLAQLIAHHTKKQNSSG